jgi:hypothetical protein
MSTTTNVQSFLPYIFRPTYAYSANAGFKTTFNIRNVDNITAGSLTIGQLQVGDSNANMYIGSSTTESANILTNNNTSNTIIGVNAGLGVSNSTGLEALGYGAGATANYVTNSSFLGLSAGCNANTVTNSLFAGANSGYSSSNVSNSLFIGSTAGSNSSNVCNSLFMGPGTGVYNSNASNIIAIGVGTSAWGVKTAVGMSNIFIGNSSATGFLGSNNVIIGHGINSNALSNAPYTFIPGGPNQYVPTNFSNKLFIGSGSNILLTGDFVSGCVSIGSTNSTPNSLLASSSIVNGVSVQTWNAIPTLGLQLDVKKYARIGYGLGIGTDPGSYALDVNGQLHVIDGSGGEMLFGPAVYGSSNGSLKLQSTVSGGTMTMDVVGQVKANGGFYSYQSPVIGVEVANGTPVSVITLPTTNGSNWTGTVVGTVFNYSTGVASIANYYTSTMIINGGVFQIQTGTGTNAGGVLWTFTSPSINISHLFGSAGTTSNLLYNFTLYPAF